MSVSILGAVWLQERTRALSRLQKRIILKLVDAIVLSASLWIAVGLRLGEVWPADVWATGWWLLVATPLAGIAIFRFSGVYRIVVRKFGANDLPVLARAVALLSLMLAAAPSFDLSLFLPRSAPIIFCVVAFLLTNVVRRSVRGMQIQLGNLGRKRQPVLIYGAGETGMQLAAALDSARDFRAVAFIDDDRSLYGSTIAGRPVSKPTEVDALMRRYGVREVFLAMPSASRDQRRRAIGMLSARPLRIRTIPSLDDLVNGHRPIAALSDVDASELLGREAVAARPELFGSVTGRCVLVTGAGGSIGSELCRQIVAAAPKKLVLFDHSEPALYDIEQELRDLKDVAVVAVLGSVGDAGRVHDVMRVHAIETVFHAAAYKHVPLVEANPVVGARNNVLGAEIIAQAAVRNGVERAVLVSTDKAVRPTSVMGATKRMAELAFLNAGRDGGTIFSMVRFGNVMNSSGSVIPLFRKQLAAGGPLTVTHPEVVRYFMTIPEAAQLVVQACSMARGGEVFMLDMGEPVRVADLARQMVHLSGQEVRDEANPGGDIEIIYTGLRPGEKLFEELLINADSARTVHPKIAKAMDIPVSDEDISEALSELRRAIKRSDEEAVLAVLERMVEGFALARRRARIVRQNRDPRTRDAK